MPDARTIHLPPKHLSALGVSRLHVGLGPRKNVDKPSVTTLTCLLSSNPRARCVIPLVYGLGTQKLFSADFKGCPVHIWMSACLQLGKNIFEATDFLCRVDELKEGWMLQPQIYPEFNSSHRAAAECLVQPARTDNRVAQGHLGLDFIDIFLLLSLH